MKKFLILTVASLAIIFSSCKKSSKDASAQTTDTVAVEAPATEAAPTTESEAFTAAQTKITDIQKQIEAAVSMEDLQKAATAVEAFRKEWETISQTVSEDEKATISELFKNVIESAQKKEAELKKK